MMPKAVCHRRIALRGAMLAALVVAAVLIVASRGAVTQVEARSAASAQMLPSTAPTSAYVKIEAVGTRRDGATGIPRTLAPFPRLSINQSGTLFLRGGNSEAPGICFTNFGPTPYADYGIQWKFDATVLAIDRGRTTLQVRFMRWRAGNPGAEREETRTITLAPADTHLLDYVDEPNAAVRCANLSVRISADPVLPESTQNLSVEFSTVDQIAGNAQSVHGQVRGKSGQLLEYSLPALLVNTAGGAPVRVQVNGTIVATVAGDGYLDIVLTTQRSTSSSKARAGGGGHVEFRARPGETAEVMLPQPAGHLLASDGMTQIDLTRAFAGHQTSFFVKVNVVQ